MGRIIRRWLMRLQIWLVEQALPVIDPKLYKSIRHAEWYIRDADEIMRRRRDRDA